MRNLIIYTMISLPMALTLGVGAYALTGVLPCGILMGVIVWGAVLMACALASIAGHVDQQIERMRDEIAD